MDSAKAKANEAIKKIMEKKDGVDICAGWEGFYIIRSDSNIDCYLRTTNLNKGKELKIETLHDSVQGGKHYLATPNHFYIIGTEKYKRINSLDAPGELKPFDLHPNCRGGDHYFAKTPHFYIFFKQKNKYRRVTNMNKDSEAKEFDIHPECSEGLYYWATDKYFYFLTWPKEEDFPLYYRTNNLNKNENTKIYPINLGVVSFLPGGLQLKNGRVFGKWEKIATFSHEDLTKNSNDKSEPVEYEWEQKYSFGLKHTEYEKIARHWDISVQTKDKVSFEKFLSSEISYSIKYGESIETGTQSEWEEHKETTAKFRTKIYPGESVYLWQYKIGFGERELLLAENLKLTHSKEIPTEAP